MCVDHNELCKILKEVKVTDYHTCFLRNLWICGSKSSRMGHGATDWFPVGEGVQQGCKLSPCLFNFCADYIMRNARLHESQAGIKIARRNINNLSYDDTTLMAEREELRSLLMRVE